MPNEPSGAASSGPSKASWGAYLEGAAKQVAGIAALLLCVSVFYDYSYFAALGVGLEEIPTTVSDHVRTALVWAPGTAVTLVLISVLVLIVPLSQGQNLSSLPLDRQERGWVKRFKDDWPMYLSSSLGIAYGLFDHSWLALYAFATGAWLYLVECVIDHPKLGRPFRGTRRLVPMLLLLVVPITALSVGAYGYNLGQSSLRSTQIAWSLLVRNERENTIRQFVAVRRFSEFAVAVEPGGRVVMLPTDRILEARKILPGRFVASPAARAEFSPTEASSATGAARK